MIKLVEIAAFLRARGTAVSAVAAVAGLMLLLGCTHGAKTEAPQSSGREVSDALSGDVLLKDVIATLNSLPNYVNTQLRPPTVVLDATTSRDGKTVMAIVSDNASQPSGRNDMVFCTSRNSRFRRLEVRPGDRVRFYAMRDEYGKQSHIEMVVVEVLDENTLRIGGGLNAPVMTPERLEIWRYADERIIDILTRLREYTDRQPVLGWEPTPDEPALEQMIERLNQWARQQAGRGTWKLDPLVSTLPEPLQKYVEPKIVEATTFSPYDARLLQQSIWLRDIAQWARGDALDDLGVAENLFDWTVRNIQLVPRSDLQERRHFPWQTLMYGRGAAEDRAWVFMLLARQQGLDVVMLALPDAKAPGGWKPWLPALYSQGEFYLFDPQLGLPIPGPDGKGVATLAQVRADDGLLRHLDLDAEHPYPVKADDLKKVAAFVEASPFELSRRAALFEEEMAGDKKVAIVSRPSELADALKKSKQIEEVRLWDVPFLAYDEQLTRDKPRQQRAAAEFQVYAWRPNLWKGRVLHFQGQFDGETSAKHAYRQVRPSDAEIDQSGQHDIEKALVRQAKTHASYWLGLLTFDNGEFGVAEDFLLNRTLKAMPDGPWTHGAKYNLARTYEAQGENDKAILLYERDDSPQSHGNRLRARWLQSKAESR